jgi:hypothetical protein
MAKKKMKPKAKPLPAKKKKAAKKSRPSRGFDTMALQIEGLTERVRALEQWRWRESSSEPGTEADHTDDELDALPG